MNYGMEELLPVVGRLAGKYTGIESTSISYEKAEQLMEAVLYCIREAERKAPTAIAAAQKASPQQMYEAGLAETERKVKDALELYHKLLPEFCSYEVRCLSDTFLKGMPQFFRRYDIKFAPQETILTLDYPVLRDLSMYTGIDRIYEYLKCIGLEQHFLNAFPADVVGKILGQYDKAYREGTDNICEIFLMSAAAHMLAGKPLSDPQLRGEDYEEIRRQLNKMEFSEVCGRLKEAVKAMAEKYGERADEIFAYLAGAAENAAVRFRHMAG